MQINTILRPSVGADYAHEQIDPGIRMGDSTVILSIAKDLRSEASRCPSRETLRCAQGDNRAR
jgi:hypothetical protein